MNVPGFVDTRQVEVTMRAVARSQTVPRIVLVPGVQGGEPSVRGTRVPVRAIVLALQANGAVPAVLQAYPRLTETDVHAALDYYAAHRSELDGIIRAQLAEA
jgi:uncharacterized protein (DUF433 family)